MPEQKKQTADLPIVGFVILSHGSSAQLSMVIDALDREYNHPPIACHHDFGQALLDMTPFGENVAFVRPHIKTSWGRLSVVEAALAALALLYERSPNWFVLLSASDYPTMPGAIVRRTLSETPYDLFMDARLVDELPVRDTVSEQTERNFKLGHFDTQTNINLKRRFYTTVQFWVPVIRYKPKLRLGRFTIRTGLKVKKVFVGQPCFFGDHWFCGNAITADILLKPTRKHLKLRRHLRLRTHADETYFQTVLMNEPSLDICLDNRRFAEWNGGGAHPILLSEKNLKEMLSSGAFFARKLASNSSVLRQIDEALATWRE